MKKFDENDIIYVKNGKDVGNEKVASCIGCSEYI